MLGSKTVKWCYRLFLIQLAFCNDSIEAAYFDFQTNCLLDGEQSGQWNKYKISRNMGEVLNDHCVIKQSSFVLDWN